MKGLRYKTLWSNRKEKFVHFNLSPLTDEVIWGYEDIPQLMEHRTTMDILLLYLGRNCIIPEGVELKTVKIEDETES